MPVYDVYHGTPTPQSIYDEGFSYLYLGKGDDSYGPGFYFTDSETLASSFARSSGNPASGTIRAKVTINKPINIKGESAGSGNNGIFGPQSPRLRKTQVRNLVSRAIKVMGKDFLSNWGDVGFEGERVVINNIVNSMTNSSVMTVMYDLFGNNPTEGLKAVRDIVGYDGVVVDFGDSKFIVAWFSEQIQIQKSQPEPKKLPDESIPIDK